MKLMIQGILFLKNNILLSIYKIYNKSNLTPIIIF